MSNDERRGEQPGRSGGRLVSRGGRSAGDEPGLATRSVHAGTEPDPATGARAQPLYRTTSYVFESADDAAERYALDAPGHVYSRISNPTVESLEARMAALEGGAGAVATDSGMAALDALTFVLAGTGDNVVAARDCYGGTAAYFSHTASRRGVDVRFVDTLDYDAYAEAIDDRTASVHVETIANPTLLTPEFDRLADIAHDAGVPLVVDNTFATPALCRPIEHGADIVWESTTKWLHGGGTTLGGVVVDGGTFPWAEHADRFPEIGGDNPAYRSVNFSTDFPDAPLAAAVRYRALRSLGGAQSPTDAWDTLGRIESLPARMERHCENAAAVASFLDDHPDVAWVAYPGLQAHPTHEEASQYLGDGYGGVVTFGLAGGFETGKRLCESVDLVSFLANIGDAKTLLIHPASTTHGQLSEEERRDAGVEPDLLRLSVGIEDPDDVIADLEAGIAEATHT